MTTRRSARLALGAGALALSAVLLIAGLAAGRARTPQPTPPRTVHLTIHFSRFDVSTIDARPGEQVRFVIENTDPIDHEFILGDDGVQLLHENGTEATHPPRPGEASVPAGTTRETTFTFAQPDQLTFACHLPGHFAYGMRGTVVVR